MVSEDSQVLHAVLEDYKSANLEKKDIFMLQYAEKLTRQVSSISERDIKGLRKFGFSDRDIFDINQVVAYFNYVNRIADGLGVCLEEEVYYDL